MPTIAASQCLQLRVGQKHLWILLLTFVALSLAACSDSGASAAGVAPPGSGKGGRRGMGGGDVPVTVAVAAQKDVPVEVQVIGNVEAYSTISVRAQVTGQLKSAFFNEGEYVRKGALLFKIDPAPLEAALHQV